MKLFSKLATAFVGIAMAIGVGVAVGSTKVGEVGATDTTIDLTAQGFSNQQEVTTVTSGTITLTFAKASGSNPPKYYTSGASVRTYANNTLTVATSGSDSITKIVFTLGGTATATPTANTGTYDSSSKTWTGSASSVTLTNAASGQYHYKTVAVTTGGGGGVDPVLESISISGEQTVYTVGDEFVKPTVTAHYDDDSSTDVTASATCTGYNMGIAGEYEVTVSYGGKTTTYNITVNDAAPEGEVLYNATFTEVETHSYTQNKEFTLNGKDWVASVSQVNGGVFYLGCNSTHAAKGILNDNSSFSDVVTLLTSVDSAYGSSVSTAHAYAMRFDNAYECVGSIEFTWAGGNNAFQVYLFGDRGSGLESLAHTNYATSGTAVSGSVKWAAAGYGEDFSSIIIVARPGATGSTATNKTLRAATFKIIEGESESTIETSIRDSYSAEGPFEVVVGNTLPLFYKDVTDPENLVTIAGADWVSDDPTVFAKDTSYSGDEYFYGRGLKEGQVTLTASKSGYKVAEATVNVVPDPGKEDLTIYEYDGSSATNLADGTTINYSSGVGTFRYVALDESGDIVTTTSWVSSDTTVATVSSSSGVVSVTTVKPGEFTLTASESNYNSGDAAITVSKSWLEEIAVSGSMSKTDYTTSDSWSSAGLTVEATYHSGWKEDVTSLVEWTYSPASPIEGTTSVVATATLEDKNASSAPQSVTVTVKHAGTAEDPFTVAEGIAKCVEIGNKTGGEGPWVTTGKISSVVQVLTSGYANARFYITEDGKTTSNSIYAYDCKYLENAGFTEETAAYMVVGATVTITGNLLNYNSNTPEYARGCYLLDIQAPESGDIEVTFNPTTSFEIGATGTFTATADDPEATLAWSVDDSSVLSVASNGAYEALSVGVARVTVTATHGEKEGTAFADIVINGNEYIDVSDANAIAASLPTGKTSDYYIYVEGYVVEFGTSKDSSGNPRAIDIMNYDENSRIMVYTNTSPYASFIEGLNLGDKIKVKANVQNYSGTYELTNPVKVDSSLSEFSFAFKLLTETDAVCQDYDGVTDNSEALAPIWETLSGSSWYAALGEDEQLALQEADSSETGTTIERAMARYDYLVGKYGLDNFISGRTPASFANQPIQNINNSVNTNFEMIVVVVVAIVSLSAVGILLVVKRRKNHI